MRLFGLIALAGLSACAQPLWKSTSGGYTVVVTAAGLTAADAAGDPVLSLRQTAVEAYQALKASREANESCTYERKFTVLSLVGPILSVRDDLYWNCQGTAHPMSEYRVTAIDLSRPGPVNYAAEDEPLITSSESKGKIAALTDLFPEKDVVAAFNADPLIKEHTGGDASGIAELNESIENQEFEVPGNPCRFQLPEDYLTRFYFHHVENGKVAVRVAMEPVAGACRAAAAQLGLLLPVPPALSAAVAAAQSGKEGILAPKRGEVRKPAVIRLQTSKD